MYYLSHAGNVGQVSMQQYLEDVSTSRCAGFFLGVVKERDFLRKLFPSSMKISNTSA